MEKNPQTFTFGDLVFAKYRNYPPWPASIATGADKDGTKFNVFFYGRHETGVCTKENICFFNDKTKAVFGHRKEIFFSEALQEIENNREIALDYIPNGKM